MYPETGDTHSQSTTRTVSSLRFSSRIIGNAGAPLHSILSESHEDIEAASLDVQYSNDPMSVMILSRQRSIPDLGVLEEGRQDEVKGLLLHGEECAQQEGK